VDTVRDGAIVTAARRPSKVKVGLKALIGDAFTERPQSGAKATRPRRRSPLGMLPAIRLKLWRTPWPAAEPDSHQSRVAPMERPRTHRVGGAMHSPRHPAYNGEHGEGHGML